jgi:N-carbamoylputrescine amidase
LTALRGAEILFYPTAIGWHPEEKSESGARQRDAWETAQRAHAIANGCFVVAVNRFGFEPDPASKSGGGIEFWGSSFVACPDGAILFRAPESGETVHVAELDLGLIARQRHGWPFLRDRRIDAYSDLTRRFMDYS